ncbi:MAG: hypothetical protein LBI60_04515 [Bacteroidales bacterium]|jgi:hypothetical protein|nr:hypothetical protein [Bacteroidales bacterium]
MKKYILIAALFLCTAYSSTYFIEASVNDEKFIIDGELYEAKSYCFGMEEGDRVMFVDGTPGFCTSAVIFNTRTRQTCDVWCE